MSIARLMNQGLAVLSPIVLVRLLSVDEFGRYREFLLYVTLLCTFASLGFNNSLLYFAAAQPDNIRQLLKQTVVLTFLGSVAAVAVLLTADGVTGGALTGPYTWAVAAYVLFYVNIDFWEFYWLARNRLVHVFAYSTGRLTARLIVVIVAAALSGDVWTIIWSIVGFEAVRLLVSFGIWVHTSRSVGPGEARPNWAEQLRYCLPVAAGTMMVVMNRSLGGLAVTKVLGVTALAYYTIGTQLQPVITVLRNSISDVLLPRMAGESRASDPLALWRRATTVSLILLSSVGVLLIEFAQPIVVTLFSEQYAAAVPLFQLYALLLVRESFDFGVPLRAANRTTPILSSNVLAFVTNIVLLLALMPLFGLIGAVAALLISRFVDGAYLAWSLLRLHRIPLSRLADWGELGKVVLASLVASLTLLGSFWTDHLGLAGVVVGSIAYLAVLMLALSVLRVTEVTRLLRGLGVPSARLWPGR
ncbi:MAG TPA: oligosaccharide flippase family protein [Steroidobacteraceae bacterium]